MKCRICKQEKPIYEFSRNRYRAHGYAYECKPCDAQRRAEWRTANPQKAAQHKGTPGGNRRWEKRHRRKFLAQSRLRTAVHRGKLKKPKRCSQCRRIREIEGHHHDYTKPLDVEWLCRQCHRARHKKYHRETTR